MESKSRDTVTNYLERGLDCAVEARPTDDAQTRFVPEEDAYGELRLADALADSCSESALLERLRRDGVDALLRRGERVKVTGVATEILPRG